MVSERFSLLLLEENEVLLEDLRARYRCLDSDTCAEGFGSEENEDGEREATELTGWMKVGTRNVFFDADNWKIPVIRISFEGLMLPPQRSIDSDFKGVTFTAEKYLEIRRGGEDHAYIERRKPCVHTLSPRFASSESVFQLCAKIADIYHLHRRERSKALQALIRNLEKEIKFDVTAVEDPFQEVTELETSVRAVFPLSTVPGLLRLTNENLYFMPIHGGLRPIERYNLARAVSWRRLCYGTTDLAVETTFQRHNFMDDADKSPDGTELTLMLAFDTEEDRNKLEEALGRHISIVAADSHLKRLTWAWQRGKVSNYEYLLKLNFLAGRSFCDLAQYPVFPWILADYTSAELDLENEATFRDLSRPVGALAESRLEFVRERFQEMPEPRFLWGTHYSTAAYVLFFLVRSAPAALLKLQSGRFDTPDRLFYSIQNAWASALSSTTDVKELIPEFFALSETELPVESCVRSGFFAPGDFLLNIKSLDLGIRQDGAPVGDVELPPWAHHSAAQFVQMNREALESPYVSAHLHEWIDLIFGYRSQSAQADNLFYTDLPENRQMDILLQFGRTPARLFWAPHPKRFGDIWTATSSVSDSSATGEANPDSCPNPATLSSLLAQVVSTDGVVWLSGGFDRGMEGAGNEVAQGFIDAKGSTLALTTGGADASLHVFNLRETTRSRTKRLPTTVKRIGDANVQTAPALAIVSSDLLLIGAPSGDIIGYDIKSGGERMFATDRASAADLSAIVLRSDVIVTAAGDSVEVSRWMPDECDIPLQIELDAEGVVEDLTCSTTLETEVLIAAGLSNGNLVAWKLRSTTSDGEVYDDSGYDPVWRNPEILRSGSKHGLCFVDNHLAVINSSGDLLIYSPDFLDGQEPTVSYVEIPGRANCIKSLPKHGTILLGTEDGLIQEYSREGMCVAQRKVGSPGAMLVDICAEENELFVAAVMSNGDVLAMLRASP